MTTPAENDTFVAGASKPPTLSKWQGFLQFLYDKKEGTVLGRTGKSWLQITIFYIIFYGVLAAFFAVLLVLFLQTLDPNEPKWTTANGIIGTTPGMGFRPTPADSGSTLIWLKQAELNKNVSGNPYVKKLGEFLEPYQPGKQDADNFLKCSDSNRPVAGDKKTCQYKLDNLGPCTAENDFGYKTGQPCVLLKLNKIYGWVPDTYSSSEIPEEVTKFYGKLRNDKGEQTPLTPAEQSNQVYVTCNGEDPVDQEHIGPIRLYPRTVPAYYFPYSNQRGYLSPVVMVQFLNPSPGVLVNIECKAWSKNIAHSRTDRLGQVHFEILVDR